MTPIPLPTEKPRTVLRFGVWTHWSVCCTTDCLCPAPTPTLWCTRVIKNCAFAHNTSAFAPAQSRWWWCSRRSRRPATPCSRQPFPPGPVGWRLTVSRLVVMSPLLSLSMHAGAPAATNRPSVLMHTRTFIAFDRGKFCSPVVYSMFEGVMLRFVLGPLPTTDVALRHRSGGM